VKRAGTHHDRSLRFLRNPLYLGSMLIAAGFAVALMSWSVALVLAVALVIYVPVITRKSASARHLSGFDEYAAFCILPRITPARPTTTVRPLFPGALPETPRVQCSFGSNSAVPAWLFSGQPLHSSSTGGPQGTTNPTVKTEKESRLPVNAHDCSPRFLRPGPRRCGTWSAKPSIKSARPSLHLPARDSPSLRKTLSYWWTGALFPAGTAVVHFEAAGDLEHVSATATPTGPSICSFTSATSFNRSTAIPAARPSSTSRR
jgi:hypothetical protein